LIQSLHSELCDRDLCSAFTTLNQRGVTFIRRVSLYNVSFWTQ